MLFYRILCAVLFAKTFPLLFKKKIFYLFIRDTQRERQRHRQREKQAPRREPDVELDPGSRAARPKPKADTQPLSHPGVPVSNLSELHTTNCP